MHRFLIFVIDIYSSLLLEGKYAARADQAILMPKLEQ